MNHLKQIDYIYDVVDQFLTNGQFEVVNDWLKLIPRCTLTDHLLAYATVTLPARHKLLYRAKFISMAEEQIKLRGEWQKGLLNGL